VRASQDYRTDFLIGDPFEPPLEIAGDIAFSCLKQAESGDGLVLRVFNPNPQPATLSLSVPARRLRLDEEEPVDGGLDLPPGEIATFLLT
jgi:alpha-mannosidase